MYNAKVGRSKTGLPTVTESGGGSTNTGGCIIVCGPSGEKVKPLFVPRGYSNGEHAIFVARVGMHIIEQSHSRSGESITAWKIVGIGRPNDLEELALEKVGEWENGDGNIPDYLKAASDAASNKGHCYHCREAHYVAG